MDNAHEIASQAARKLGSWLSSIPDERPPAVVLGGSPNGLSFARSLGRRRVPTLLLESRRCLGTYTRYANVLLLPSADESPEVWIRLLELVGSRLSTRGVLFATSDGHTLLGAACARIRHAGPVGRLRF